MITVTSINFFLCGIQVLDPVDIAVVSLCSTKNLMLEGGPLPWIVDTSGYYEEGNKEICGMSLMQILIFLERLQFKESYFCHKSLANLSVKNSAFRVHIDTGAV